MRALTLVVALAAFVAAGCGSGTETASPTDTTPTETETTTTPLPDQSARPPAPPIAGTSLDGETISLAGFRGRSVLVNVWSSWWSTCQSEAVAYAEFQKDHSELAYLGIDVADTVDEGRAFVDRNGWTWPSIQDPLRERARRLGADYQPHFILVDEDGRIVATHEGRGDAGIWDALAAQLP